MLTRSFFRVSRRLAMLAVGSSLILSGCDPTIRQTAETGIINASTSLFASFLQAFIRVLSESSA